MDQGWRRFLVILLAFWSIAVKFKVGAYPRIHPQWGHPSRNSFSPRAAQSSVSEASVTGISPVEVGSNVLPDSSQESGSKFSQYVKDIASQLTSGPSLQSQYSSTSRSSSGPQSASAFSQIVSTPEGSSSYPTYARLGSWPLSVYGQSTTDQSASDQSFTSLHATSSHGSSSSQSAEAAFLPLYSQGSVSLDSLSALSAPGSVSVSQGSLESLSQFPSQSSSDQSSRTVYSLSSRSTGTQGSVPSNGSAPSAQESAFSLVSSGPVLFTPGGSGSYSGLPQSQSMSSLFSPVTMYSKLGTLPLRISGQSTSDQSSHSLYMSGAPSSPGIKLPTFSSPVSVQRGSSAISAAPKPQCVSGQYASVFPTKHLTAPMSSLLGVSSQSSILSSRQNAFASQGSSHALGDNMSSPYSGSIQSQGASNQHDPGYLAYTELGSSPLGGSSQSISDQAFYSQNSPTSQVGSLPQAGSSQFVYSQGGSRYNSGSLPQSQESFGPHDPAPSSKFPSTLVFSPQGVFRQSATAQSSNRQYTSTFPGSSDTLLDSTSFPLQGSSTYVDSSPQPQATKSPFSHGSSLYVPLSSPQGVSQDSKAARAYSLSQSQMAQRWQPSASTQGFRTTDAAVSPSSFPSPSSQAPSMFSSLSSPGGPSKLVSTHVGSGSYSGPFPQSQSTSNRYTPGSLAYAKLGSTPLGVSTQSFSDLSSSSLYGSSSTNKAGAQLATSSNFVSAQGGSGSTVGSALQSKDVYSEYAPLSPSLDVNVPVSSQYYQATPSGSWSQKWQPSTSRMTQGIQNSGTSMSQSSSSTRSSTSRFFSSAGGLGRLHSMQGGMGYSSLSPSQSSSSRHTPGSLAYAKLGSTPLGVSTQSSSDPSSSSPYGSSSTNKAGARLATFSRFVSAQRGSGSALQSKDVYSQYAPLSPSLDVKVPVSSLYYQATPSGSFLSQKRQPSSLGWTRDVQTPDAAVSPSSFPSQSSWAPSMFYSPSSHGGPSRSLSTQVGSGNYRGLFPQSQSTSSPYTHGSLAYAKLGSTPLGVSTQSSSDQSSSSLYGLGSRSKSGSQLATFSRLMSVQGGSSSNDVPSAQLQNPSSQLSSVSSLSASVPMSRQYSLTPSVSTLSQSKMPQRLPSSASSWMHGIQTSERHLYQSSSSPQSSQPPSGFLSALSPPVNSVTQSGKTPFSASQSLFGVERPSRLLASHEAPLSTINSQMSGCFASLQRPTDSNLTPSLDLNAQAASMFSGPSPTPSGFDSQSDVYQLFSNVTAPIYQPSHSSSSRYYSMVKG